MSVKESFESAWKARFSCGEIPQFSWLENTTDQDVLERSYRETKDKIDSLKAELERQEFIAGFIYDKIHNTVNTDGKSEQGNDSVDGGVRSTARGADVNGLKSHERQAKSESLSEQEEFWYQSDDITVDEGEVRRKPLEREDSVFSTSGSQAEHPLRELRGFLGSLSGESEVGSAGARTVEAGSEVMNTERPTVPGGVVHNPNEHNQNRDENKSGSQNMDLEINEYSQVKGNPDGSKISASARRRRERSPVYEEINPRTFKETNLDDFTSCDSEYRSSLTDNEKAFLHTRLDRTDSAGSVDSATGERRKRPPVPTPRPSVKGPTLTKRTNGDSVRDKSGSDSEAIDDFKQEYYGGVVIDEKKRKPSSPSSVKRCTAVHKPTPPLLKRRGDKKENMANTDLLEQGENSDPPTNQTQKMRLQMNQKSRSLDSGSTSSMGSPTLPTRASGLYRRGVYVNNDDKSRQKFLQRNYNRMDSKGSQCSMDSVDELYDNMIPPHKEDGETSSDEEEPIYYNVLLMKQHSLHKVSIDASALYASVDLQKKELEKQARRLSRRFSRAPLGQDDDDDDDNAFLGNRQFDGTYASIGEGVPGTYARIADDVSSSDGAYATVVINPGGIRGPSTQVVRENVYSEPTERPGSSGGSRGSPSGGSPRAAPGMYAGKKLRTAPELPPRSSPCPSDDDTTAHNYVNQTALEPGDDGTGWRKRSSMLIATEGEDGAPSSKMDSCVPAISAKHEVEKAQMRKWVVTSILDSERGYVNMLDVLLQYMRSFQAAATTSQPLLATEDIDQIFNQIPQLHAVHMNFIQELQPIIKTWSPDKEVANAFKVMALEEYPVASDYLKNYHRALATLQRCTQENAQFAELTRVIKTTDTHEANTLEDLLHKPIVRIQRNTLVLHDLIKCTPTSHKDYDMLQKTLRITQHFLENQSPFDSQNPDHQRYLVKNGMIVENVGKSRKLRHVFLFNDVIVCTKQKLNRQKLNFDVKWFIPLTEVKLENQTQEEQKNAAGRKQEVEALQKRVNVLQNELRSEIRRNKSGDHSRQWSIRGGSRNIEKIKKKLVEQEAQLILASPHLAFKVRNRTNKQFILLMSSDYERNEWRESVEGLKSKLQSTPSLQLVDLQNQINALKLPKLSAITSMLEGEDWDVDEEQLFGSLNVTIHKLQGLSSPADTFCCIEVDSFSHFSMRAKTKLICSSGEPTWNAAFDLDLEGAQTLRILCYRIQDGSDILLGKCALELSKAWLRGDFQEKMLSLNDEISLVISLRYASREQTIKRTLSAARGGVFGVKISHLTSREGVQIPLLVTTCVAEVERRGLRDLGIYRVSGLSSEIQRLKKAFEKNSKGAIPLALESDVNVLTGLLKLYFRELPEALFTDRLYTNFWDGMSLSDPEAKQKCMLQLLRELPEPNYATALYILDHLIKVARFQNDNKMSINNLATVFGPTLLRPAAKESEQSTMDLFCEGARDAMMQTTILYFFLHLRNQGVDFKS